MARYVVKRIFRYLKGQPTLGLWYPKDSPMDLIAYSDSDYAGASIDRKSTTGGCQFLGCRLISWQCKKQTIVANSTTEAEYIAASNCCGQVLWLQNQLLDYGYNFMKTKIHVDNESAICVVKNHVYHSKTKHIEIRHHFIRDSYEKKLIEMVKIHTDYNVADLLTKAFDVTRFQFLIASIGEAHDVYYALKYDWKDLLHQTKSVKHIGKSKEVRTLRYLSLVVPLTKVGDEAVHKELGDRMERAATTASSLEAEQDSGSDPRITSSPSLSLQHTPFTAPSTSQPSNIHTTLVVEEAASMPHESPLQSVHSLGHNEGSLSLHELTVLCTNLSNKVKKLDQTMNTSQSRRRTRVVLSDKEEVFEDPSKQGRSLIEELDLDAKISLTAELVEEPTKLVEDQGSGEKGEHEVTTTDTALNTASVPISTASATPEVSTAAANLVYIRKSAEKRKDKGKTIMIEDESVQKKSKKQLEQERLSHEEAIRLQEQVDEEERKRIARDAEIAKQLQEEYDKARKKEVVAEVDIAHVIDWNDPSVIRYHALQKDYPLTKGLATLMLCNKLRVDQKSEMAD
ncbi:hypothetical protein Tco_0168306 [Tanacetum coccineum]